MLHFNIGEGLLACVCTVDRRIKGMQTCLILPPSPSPPSFHPSFTPLPPLLRRVKEMHEAWEGFCVDRMWTDLANMPE